MEGLELNNRIFGLVMVIVASLLSVGTGLARLTPYAKSLYGGRSELRLEHKRRNAHRAGRAHIFYPNPSASEIDSMVAVSADQYQINPQLVHAIIKVESGYNTNARSPKGAKGLMQLIPEIARKFGAKNPFNPQQNISAGVAYLKHLLGVFSGDVSLSVAAYNAGPNAVLRHGGVPDYPETTDYVQKVTTLYQQRLLASVIPLLAMKSGS